MREVDFYYDYISPYAYLAQTQLSRLGLRVRYKAIDILDVMQRVNNQPSPRCPAKLAYALVDTQRWAKRYGVRLAPNAQWWSAVEKGTFDLRLLSRGAIAAQELGCFAGYHAAVFSAVWGGVEADLVSAAGREALLRRADVSAGVWTLAAQAAIGEELDRRSEAAAKAGIFGVPTFAVGGELFFGNDRLDFVVECSRELAAGAGA